MAQDASEDYLRYQGNALILRLGRYVWPMHVLSAALLSYSLRIHFPAPLIAAWAAWMVLFALWQGVICFRGSALAAAGAPLGHLPLAFDVSAVLLALSWGFLGLVFFPAGDTDLQVFIGFIIGGAVLTGVGTHNMHFPMLAATLSIIVPAQVIRLLIEHPDAKGVIPGAMLLVFMVLMLALGWALRSFTRRGFLLQWEKMELARQLEAQAEILKSARAEADAANEAKSLFFAQASHDLRQPVHSMGLFLAALSKDALPARTREILTRIEQSVDALSKLFNSLLDVTLLDTGQTRPEISRFAASEPVEGICEEFALAARVAGVRLSYKSSGAIIRSDPLIVRRILQNLVSNAIKHAQGTDVRVHVREEAAGIFFDVSDTGRGIAPSEQARIFEEFERSGAAAEAVDGFGLGLAIVRRLSEVLQIGVSLRSRPGSGTTFSVGPFEKAAFVDDAKPVEEIEPAAASPGRALVIDDDRAVCEAVAALLARWGWEVETCADVPAAKIYEIEPPDLIVSDHDLGTGRTGLDIISTLRAAHGPVPALIISGSSTPEMRERVLRENLVLLHKPVRPAQLRSAILSVLG
ncbi:hybrid sensor histidine kinase/response regulator [Parvibaculum sp.]|uniref:ATP-binding response regulator n=1 Tax=Parvibaculum sp. TaxID=2024848 RepID=UPI001DD7F575|nr:hybrid sensor histidine kinase/response regulator [Parvibaculum sp.]MBX3488674.1 hybrid sensor histidine kinase/response regulator [Parvibaculum sp.]MCW5727443.1 hybrid sensor histidine kinase/response regulator [Parvibaculum sp.]